MVIDMQSEEKFCFVDSKVNLSEVTRNGNPDV